MNILHVIGTMDPSYGGPVEGLKQLTSSVSKLDHSITIITLDKFNLFIPANKNISIIPLGPSYGKYRLNLRLIPWLIKNVNKYDFVVCHGIWQFHSLATWISCSIKRVPYFIFTHGALDPWFRYNYPLKHFKKWLYWPWAEYQVLRNARAVLFTSEEEKLLAPKSFRLFKANGVVVNYGISKPAGDSSSQKEKFFSEYPNLRDKQILLFLSRIHPKKGCDILLEAFSKLVDKNPSLHLVIAGPDENGWQSYLESKAENLKIINRVTWTGMLKDDLKWGAINAADCFVLPSHSENFGIVVVEALACGIPVIITDKVNIWREIQKEGAGIVGLDTIDGLVSSLQLWLNLSESERLMMRQNAKKCFLNFFEIESNVQNFLNTITKELKT